MTIRDKRQAEFAHKYLKSSRYGILDLCPRFGKIWTTINILETYPEKINILICYPDTKIEESWEKDFEARGYDSSNVTYTTHRSMHKYVDEIYDMIIIDEIHLLSINQIDVCKELFALNRTVLGLTGTLSAESEAQLDYELGLKVVGYYPIELGVKEKVVTDYQITVIKVPLDNRIRGKFKKATRTERTQYNALTWVINKKSQEGEDTMFLRLSRMRLIQNSEAKRLKTIKILNAHKDERILVFCGSKKSADSLGIPSFHSDTKDKDSFKRFAEGKGKHMAVCKIGNAGTTYKPLSKVIVNYFDSNSENLAQKINRCMGMEYDNLSKKADIIIISTNESVELNWLRKALEFFDPDKIKYV